jgi:hypothetical protein
MNDDDDEVPDVLAGYLPALDAIDALHALTFDYCQLCDADVDAEHADEEGHTGICCQCHAREGGRC